MRLPDKEQKSFRNALLVSKLRLVRWVHKGRRGDRAMAKLLNVVPYIHVSAMLLFVIGNCLLLLGFLLLPGLVLAGTL